MTPENTNSTSLPGTAQKLLATAVLTLWGGLLGALVAEKAFWAATDPATTATGAATSAIRALASVAHDGLPLAIACLGLALSGLFASKALRLLLRLPALLFILLMTADMAVRMTFSFRLNWDDVAPYLDVVTILQVAFGSPALSLLALLALALLLLALGARLGNSLRAPLGFAAAATLALGAFLLAPKPQSDPDSWQWRNVFSQNMHRGVDRPFARDWPDQTAGLRSCTATGEQLPSYDKIVMVVVESLSAYQSSYFSGFNNWTPELDLLARKGWSFVDFHANNFNTAGGLVALFAGDIPLQPPSVGLGAQLPIFAASISDAKAGLLPAMRQQGWTTGFISSGNLSFSGKDQWLQKAGFSLIEGSEHPSYDGQRRFVFNGASDEHLYRRAEQLLTELRPPWFLAMETISTHPPYEDPDSSTFSLQRTVRYADRELGRFARTLERAGFFRDGGLLIVTSDHRSMHRLHSGEQQQRQRRAESWIPLVIYGGRQGPSGRNERTFQQTDLYNGLRSLVTRSSCTTPWRGDLWLDRPAQCQFYVSAGNRSHLYSHCGSNSLLLGLAGDETDVLLASEPTTSPPQWLLPQINHWRSRQKGEVPPQE